NISFTASTAGCSKPHGPTRFGPGRICIQPMTLRSKSIAYANVVITTNSRTAHFTSTTHQTVAAGVHHGPAAASIASVMRALRQVLALYERCRRSPEQLGRTRLREHRATRQ